MHAAFRENWQSVLTLDAAAEKAGGEPLATPHDRGQWELSLVVFGYQPARTASPHRQRVPPKRAITLAKPRAEDEEKCRLRQSRSRFVMPECLGTRDGIDDFRMIHRAPTLFCADWLILSGAISFGYGRGCNDPARTCF